MIPVKDAVNFCSHMHWTNPEDLKRPGAKTLIGLEDSQGSLGKIAATDPIDAYSIRSTNHLLHDPLMANHRHSWHRHLNL